MRPLICYGQSVVWPILQSTLRRPAAIIATGNGWWTVGTSIIDIQNASTIAWARLFGVPLTYPTLIVIGHNHDLLAWVHFY